MIDLNAYCASRFDSRAAMRSPYRDGDHIVATDGRIMIALDVVERPGITDQYPTVAQTGLPSFHQLDRFEPGPHWHRLADIELPAAVTCGLCLGTGVDLDMEHEGDYACLECYGVGELLAWLFIGGVALNTRYLRMIAGLPGCEIAPANRYAPAPFRFNGGHGWIMPVNVVQTDETAA